MDTKTPKLNVTKTTTKDFKVKSNLKAGETTSYNKIKWTF